MLFKRLFIMLWLFINFFFISCSKENINYNIKPLKDTDVASITLYSYDGKSETKYLIPSYGHTFLEFTNISDQEIILYHQVIKPNESIVFSWWAIDLHMGIWFNIEPYYIYLYNRYDTRYSTTIYIDANDVKEINGYMKNNDIYDPLNNCSKMTLGCWNLVAENTEKIKVYLVTTPSYVLKNIKKFDKFTYCKNISSKGSIGYIDGITFKEYKMEIQND